MTVRELIERLERMPRDAEVTYNDDSISRSLTRVELFDTGLPWDPTAMEVFLS